MTCQAEKKKGRGNLAVKKSTNDQPGERDCSSKQQPKLNHWSLLEFAVEITGPGKWVLKRL